LGYGLGVAGLGFRSKGQRVERLPVSDVFKPQTQAMMQAMRQPKVKTNLEVGFDTNKVGF